VAGLIDVAYVETISGSEVAEGDEARCEALIEIASDLVREEVGTAYTPENAPAKAKQAVCQLVLSALNAPGDESVVKAEQIGDYRVEFSRPGGVMDISTVEHLLEGLAIRSYSVRTPLALDGVDVGAASYWPFVDDDDEEGEVV
jgi:hypothetical protein